MRVTKEYALQMPAEDIDRAFLIWEMDSLRDKLKT
jgi:hypothetical protein